MRIPTLCRFFLLFCMALLGTLMLSACATPQQPPIPMGNLGLGVAFFTQPQEPADMLAGYVVEDTPRIDTKILNEMDALFADVLLTESQKSFRTRESALQCAKKIAGQRGRNNNQAALRTWSSIGRCMGVDVLVVPQLLEYRKRDGGPMGVTSPAKVIMDIFVLDVRNESLISRSHFDETQSALANNLLDAGKFVKRGGKWITARDLAEEGMRKATKELGL